MDWNPTLENELYLRAFLEPAALGIARAMALGMPARAEALAAEPVPAPGASAQAIQRCTVI